MASSFASCHSLRDSPINVAKPRLRVRFAFFLGLCSLQLLAIRTCTAATVDESQKAFVERYMTESKPLYDYLDRVRIRARTFDLGSTTVWLDYWLAVNGKKRVFGTYRKQGNEVAERTTCETPDYMFQLSRVGTGLPKLKFVLRKDEIHERERVVNTQERVYPAIAPVSIFGFIDLREALTTGGFSVAVSGIADEQEVLLVLKDLDNHRYVREARLRLDPRRAWVIRDLEATIDWAPMLSNPVENHCSGIRTKMEYDDKLSEYVPSRTVLHFEKKVPGLEFLEWQVTKVEPGNVRDEEFLLSGYGVPDAPIASLLGESRRSRMSVLQWLCVGVILAVIVMQVAPWAYRRRRSE